jgi:hypothetical protein
VPTVRTAGSLLFLGGDDASFECRGVHVDSLQLLKMAVEDADDVGELYEGYD